MQKNVNLKVVSRYERNPGQSTPRVYHQLADTDVLSSVPRVLHAKDSSSLPADARASHRHEELVLCQRKQFFSF